MVVVKRRSSKKKYFFIGGLLLCTIVITLVLLFIKLNSGSSEGSASSIVLTAPSQSPVFNATPVTVVGKYASFNYPLSLKAVTNSSPKSAVLASYVYIFPDVETWRLAVSVYQLAGPSLMDNSNYVFRTEHPDEYKQSSLDVNGKSYIIMTTLNQPGFNEVAFCLNGDRAASISLYGDGQSGVGNLQLTMQMVLKSWQWL